MPATTRSLLFDCILKAQTAVQARLDALEHAEGVPQGRDAAILCMGLRSARRIVNDIETAALLHNDSVDVRHDGHFDPLDADAYAVEFAAHARALQRVRPVIAAARAYGLEVIEHDDLVAETEGAAEAPTDAAQGLSEGGPRGQ